MDPKRIIFLLISGFILHAANAAVWQFSTDVPGGTHHSGQARAYLWIPPKCKKIKAIVFAQHNMEEISILEHPKFRKNLEKLDVAEIWASPPFNLQFLFDRGAGESFNAMLDSLSEKSGYVELREVPVIPIGHSAAASAPYYFAAWAPEKTLAAISISGQWPYFRHEQWAPDIWGEKNINFIPCLETMGEYESAATWSKEGLKEHAENPYLPLSMLACPAEGHFSASEDKIEYLNFYIRKVLEYRLKNDKLIPVDPTKTGWLMEKWRKDTSISCKPAPVNEYSGDPANAFWFFDKKHARITNTYQEKYRYKQVPLLGIMQNKSLVQQQNTHQQLDLKFLPEDDGVTFKLEPVFLDTVPDGSPRPANWTGEKAGTPIRKPVDSNRIYIEKICGPVLKVAPNTFRFSLERGLGDELRQYELWFAIKYPGNSTFRPAVQQVRMVVPLKNVQGKPQSIEFNPPENMYSKSGKIELKATSDAGLQVRFYVESGPASIKENMLTIESVPVKSTFPIEIKVVAYQYGRKGSSPVQSADPIKRTILISK